KLVATKTRGRITTAQFLTKTLSQSAEGGIAGVVAHRVVQVLEAIEIEYDERQRLLHTPGHQQIFIELHFERAAVVTTGQRVGQSLLLNLREQSGMIYGHRYLISDSPEQENLILMPKPGRIGRGHLQGAQQALLEDER